MDGYRDGEMKAASNALTWHAGWLDRIIRVAVCETHHVFSWVILRMHEQPTCADCQEEMESGFIPDASYSGALRTNWHRGRPDEKKFLGLRIPSGMGSEFALIKYDSTQMMPVTTYRCPQCGLLRSYALGRDDE